VNVKTWRTVRNSALRP